MGKEETFQNTVLFPKCPGKIEVPTEKEREALRAMKSIKGRVRAVKERLRSLGASQNNASAKEVVDLEEELVRLKTDWEIWEEKRKNAARERMILLGHESE